MAGRVHKKIRRVANKRFMLMLGSIAELPFRKRLRIAWMIVKGPRSNGGR